MSRYIRRYNCTTNEEMIMSQINTYLISQGYTYKNYDGEMVYHKGNGWVSTPKCFKVYRIGSDIMVEGWMKWSLLPFIAVGEMDFSDNSFVGALPKKQMRADAEGIEKIIYQTHKENVAAHATWGNEWANETVKKEAPQSSSEIDTEATMGYMSYQDAKVNTSVVNPVSKKEYLFKYADIRLIKDIKKAAIIGYICSGITAILGLLLMNIGIIIEVILMVGLLLGMHLGRKKSCAIAYLCVAILDCMVSIVTTGNLSGWLIIIAGIWAVFTFRKIDKEYEKFVANGYKNEPLQTENSGNF